MNKWKVIESWGFSKQTHGPEIELATGKHAGQNNTVLTGHYNRTLYLTQSATNDQF